MSGDVRRINTTGQQRSILDCFGVFAAMKYAEPSRSMDFPKAKPVVIRNLWKRDARIMGQRAAQVKFTVVITIVQAVIAVFFGLFVRCNHLSLPLISCETSIRKLARFDYFFQVL